MENLKSKINAKLSNIQLELKAPKSQYNSFGKYNYRSCEDIVEAVKPLLAKQGMSLIITDEVVLVGDDIGPVGILLEGIRGQLPLDIHRQQEHERHRHRQSHEVDHPV